MSNDHIPESDEVRLAALLRSIDAKLPSPDQATLDELRARAEERFLNAAGETPAEPVSTGAAPTTKPLDPPRRTWLWRSVAALAASVAVVVMWLSFVSSSGAVPFSNVLADLHSAKSLQLRVMRNGETAEVFVRTPGDVRAEQTPQRYRITSGSRLWKVNETANTVTAGEAPWYSSSQQQVDLLKLLEVGLDDTTSLLRAKPVARSEYAGRECSVYRANLTGQQGELIVEAFADPTTHRLLGIVARPAKAPPQAVPLAELQLVAVDVPLDETKFVVAKSLTEDGRIGKLTDTQGVVLLRPALAERWTPVCRDVLLKPGDWLRTDLRGANAACVRLSSQVELTLGPGTQIECISATQARVHAGELQVSAVAKDAGPFELLAPRQGGQTLGAAGKQVWRVDRDEKLAAVKERPAWLAGFEGTSSAESLGSLIVKLPDGRNEPLSVGYHKVSVEIRDQIARTTIEESFVNHTNARLEGVFHFPLPQEASISGFGMWIGSELIEADIVEKQRAREIYETILRENRDPGLLEWTGGNIFKARVFPIEANSEKRVKIVYTQVLPLKGNSYRYTYGLRSELLRTKPLRELSLTVSINSALPLKSVSCPTHPTRLQRTGHSAQVEFAAQEYTPDRDLDVVCEVDGRGSDVVVIPHRRGADGYFLLQLMPPAAEGNWRRDVLPDSGPLSLVLLCDTSGSMDALQRKQQAEFVSAILLALGMKDRFLLAAADVETVWSSVEPLPATAENIAAARAFLDKRRSLGWTDLNRAFAATLKKAPAGAHVIYIGDGIVSTGAAEPASFVKELTRLVAATQPRPMLHAVGVGNTTESMVLQGIAVAGKGSVRMIGGDQSPSAAAVELLSEITRPGLQIVNVEFKGIEVAAVYPEQPPRLTAGAQQIMVGRYLPTGKHQDQQGEVVVNGLLGNEKVRYAAKVSLRDAEQGNSFIPRLWARAHLDYLLKQGNSQAIRDQIIALSEEFHIITPYTSLLVLETDADRERFRVKRRFEMRDGEVFFAQGRHDANYDLRQQQIVKAKDWRLGLRRQVLQSLSGLGRGSLAMSPIAVSYYGTRKVMLSSGQATTGLALLPFLGAERGQSDELVDVSMTLPEETRGRNRIDELVMSRITTTGGLIIQEEEKLLPISGAWEELSERRHNTAETRWIGLNVGEPTSWDEDGSNKRGLAYRDYTIDKPTYETRTTPEAIEASLAAFDTDDLLALTTRNEKIFGKYDKDNDGDGVPDAIDVGDLGRSIDHYLKGENLDGRDGGWDLGLQLSTKLGLRSELHALNSWKGKYAGLHSYRQSPWFDSLFPYLGGPPRKRLLQPGAPSWPQDVVALSKSLLRTDALRKLAGGIELRRVTESFDPKWKDQTWRNSELVLYGPQAWLTRGLDPHSHTVINYCEAKERGVFSLAFLLGRTRKARPADTETLPFSLDDGSVVPLSESYALHTARIEPVGQDRVNLVVAGAESEWEVRFLIETTRHVLLNQQMRLKGKVSYTTTYDDFVELGGCWWSRRSVTTDAQDRKTAETRLNITLHEPAKYAERMKAELAAKAQVQFLQLPLPTLAEARQRVADGTADFGDRLRMVQHFESVQQWQEMLTHLEAAEKLAVDKPGMRWLRTLALSASRRHEETRQRLLSEAKQLAAGPRQDELYLAEFLIEQIRRIASAAEQLELVENLQPVQDRQPADLPARSPWQSTSLWRQEALLNCYERLSRTDEALALQRKLAEAQPWNLNRQLQYARQLQQAGEVDAALAWLVQQLDRPENRESNEEQSLRSTYGDICRAEARWADWVEFTGQWIARQPEYEAAYAHRLSALFYDNQSVAANGLVEGWLKEAVGQAKLSAAQRARVEAAVRFACGNGQHLSFQRIDDRWHKLLGDVARASVDEPERFSIVQTIMQSSLADSETGDRLRGHFLAVLATDAASLTPQQSAALVGWTLDGRIEVAEPLNKRRQMSASELPNEVWEKIAAAIKQKWTKEKKPGERHQLGETLRTIYVARFADSLLLPFLRERIATAAPQQKAHYVAALLEAILARPWTDQGEQEAFETLRKLSDEKDPIDRLAAELPVLQQLVDRLIQARLAVAEQKLRDAGKLKELTRQELMKKREEAHLAARKGMAARLWALADDERGPLGPWLRMEQAYLDVKMDVRLPQIEEQCWNILGQAPPRQEAEEDQDAADTNTPTAIRKQVLDAMLRGRAWAIVGSLAARQQAKPATIERALKYIDAGIAQGKEGADGWRAEKFRLLVALDRPDDLERELRAWVRQTGSTSAWRTQLALLIAERGRLEEAIQLFESTEHDRLLASSDYRTLSDWYLAVGRRADYQQARVESYKQMPEQVLSNRLSSLCYRWRSNQGVLPTTLDEDTLLSLQALFEKSERPENYLWHLRELYGASRDFRLLKVVPDGALGRTPQQIHSIVVSMINSLLYEVRSEAPVDAAMARIDTLRQRKLTPTDLRALDLMEVVIARRAAEVLNQPGPHVVKCLAAMKRAFAHPWGEGEPALMAAFLGALGKLPHADLAAEQLRELRALREMLPPGSRDRLAIAAHLGTLMYMQYNQRDAALQLLESDVRAFGNEMQGRWPFAERDVLGDYVRLLEGAGRFAAGESVLKKYLVKVGSDEERVWLEDRLLRLYNQSLMDDGEVSLGKGATLLANLMKHSLAQLADAKNERTRYGIVSQLINTLSTAQHKQFPGAAELIEEFAFKTIPDVLQRQTDQYGNTVRAPLSLLRDALGHRQALRYVVERMEQYPQWLEVSWQSAFATLGSELAEYRSQAAEKKLPIADLTPRVLALSVNELKRNLRGGEYRNANIYSKHHQHFWKEKKGIFAEAANEVYAQRKSSGRIAQQVAEYLSSQLDKQDRAIDILLEAHTAGLLDDNGEEMLILFLWEEKRFAELIPLLEPRVQTKPDDLKHRTDLMEAYFHTKRQESLLRLLKQTDAYFHLDGRWQSTVAAYLGYACLDCNLPKEAVAYLTEAIAMHGRSSAGMRLSDTVPALSEMHRRLALAHSALGQTKQAVDAASAAVVVWPPQHKRRQEVLDTLKEVLEKSKDLGAFVRSWDDQAATSGQDSPLLRKTLGQIYQTRGEHARAVVQLRLAVHLQPGDRETHQALITSLDAQKQTEAATEQLFQLIVEDRRNLPLYEQLAQRLKESPAEAERALTSIAEAAPQESENHTALAELRQKQGRWDEATLHWERVADLRRLEPTGLLNLAKAQVHQKQWLTARKTIEKLKQVEWPSRFEKVDEEVRRLSEQLPK